MRVWGAISVFDRREEELIHRAMLEILDKVGVVVESEEMLARIADFGGRVDGSGMRAAFSPDFVEGFIADSERFDWESVEPFVEARAHVYSGYYLDPETDKFEPWTLQTVLRYLKVAHHLEHPDGRISYPFPIDGIPDEALLLFFNYLMLKLNGISIASVNNIRWAEPLLEMCGMAAEELNVPLGEVVRVHVHMISPLKLGKEEARIFHFLADRGLRLGLGCMDSAGGTAPVTLAGALALALAEGIFINIVRRAYFGDRAISLGCSISPLDMRTGMYPYGRPEKELCNIAMAQMARRYGAHFHGHCGHSDAKRPSVEAGFQKALNSIPTLMACGSTTISCGLLSVDEVFSPIQLIIDNEIVSALRHFARGFEVSEDTLALDVVKEVGPGGCFLDAEHTAAHHRTELWEPRLFSRNMFSGWQQGGMKTDADYAMDIYRDIAGRDPAPARISGKLERALLDVIRRATGARIDPVDPV